MQKIIPATYQGLWFTLEVLPLQRWKVNSQITTQLDLQISHHFHGFFVHFSKSARNVFENARRMLKKCKNEIFVQMQTLMSTTTYLEHLHDLLNPRIQAS